MTTKFHRHEAGISWKGQTLQQITTSILLNTSTLSNSTNPRAQFFNPLPLPVYRRELTKYGCVKKTASSINNFEIPNGFIVSNTANGGLVNTFDITVGKNTANYYNPTILSTNPTTNFATVCLSQQSNAKTRVRSGGMIRKKFTVNGRNIDPYCTNTNQYLTNRCKTFTQNQFHNIRSGNAGAKPGSVDAINNIYATNDTSYDCSFNNVYYKPSNYKFANQGGVSSSALIVRKKYNTINTTAYNANKLYGTGSATMNAYAYGIPDIGYTVKEKIGFSKINTPVVSKFADGSINKCFVVRIKR